MKDFELERLLDSEIEKIEGGTGAQGTCLCENGGAGETVIVYTPNVPEPNGPILV